MANISTHASTDLVAGLLAECFKAFDAIATQTMLIIIGKVKIRTYLGHGRCPLRSTCLCYAYVLRNTYPIINCTVSASIPMHTAKWTL